MFITKNNKNNKNNRINCQSNNGLRGWLIIWGKNMSRGWNISYKLRKIS